MRSYSREGTFTFVRKEIALLSSREEKRTRKKRIAHLRRQGPLFVIAAPEKKSLSVVKAEQTQCFGKSPIKMLLGRGGVFCQFIGTVILFSDSSLLLRHSFCADGETMLQLALSRLNEAPNVSVREQQT